MEAEAFLELSPKSYQQRAITKGLCLPQAEIFLEVRIFLGNNTKSTKSFLEASRLKDKALKHNILQLFKGNPKLCEHATTDKKY